MPVWIDGAGPFDFVLDTGTSTTVIHHEFARRLGLRPIDRVELITVAGTMVVPRSVVGRVTLGSVSAQNVEALWSDLREVRAAVPGAVGVLGQNFLASFNYVLDYERRTMEFETGGELAQRLKGERLPIEPCEGRLIVACWGTSAGEPLRLVLDSGAGGLLLFESGRRRLNRLLDFTAPAVARVGTDAGSRSATVARITRLKIGGADFFDLPAVLPTRADSAARTEDGLLPSSLFRAVYVNNRAGYVIFNPQRR